LRGQLDDHAGTWLAKVDAAGQVLWQNVYGRELGQVQILPDGGYFLSAGQTHQRIAPDGSVIGNGLVVTWAQPNPQGGYTLVSGNRAARYFTDPQQTDWNWSVTNFGGYSTVTRDGGALFAYAGVYVDTSVYWAPQMTDIKVIKISPQGEVLQRVYGKLVGDETLDFVQATGDGGALLAGSHAYEELGADLDLWLMKLNSGGSLSWQTTLKLAPQPEFVRQIFFLQNGYLIPVEVDYGQQLVLVRLKANGSLGWQKAISSSRGPVLITAAADTPEGGLLLAGETSEKNSVYWLARLDPKGNLLWEKTVGYEGLPGAPGNEIEAILPLENGEILLGGNTDLVGATQSEAFSAWLARIPDSGQKLGFLNLQPGRFTLTTTLGSRPNTLKDEILPAQEIFLNETMADVQVTTLQPVPVCLPLEVSFPLPAALPTLTPSVTPTPSFARDLYLANPPLKGEDVLKLQQRLLELGYTEVGTPDGVFGGMTAAAVRHFQERNGLEVDGYVGPKTWKALFSAGALPASP
jgi:hypothetical protein